jgi:hypothetical protein
MGRDERKVSTSPSQSLVSRSTVKRLTLASGGGIIVEGVLESASMVFSFSVVVEVNS